MLIMWTAEDPADPLSKLVCAQRILRLYHLTFAMDPLGLYGVQPRALFGQKAAYDPHSIPAVFDLAVMFSEPPPYLFRDVPACVVPDENHNLLCSRLELLATPPEELSRYRVNRPTIHETQPRLIELRQVESVAGDGFRIGIVFSDRFLKEAQRLSHFGPAALKVGKASRLHQHSSSKPTAHSESAATTSISRSRRLFLYKGSGELIQRLARCQRTPRRRAKVARMVSPETRLSTSPSSKATCAAISKVQRLESLPNSLGERWSISLKVSALFWSKTARVLLGREEPGVRASRPLSLKSWMASRTVCWVIFVVRALPPFNPPRRPSSMVAGYSLRSLGGSSLSGQAWQGVSRVKLG